MTSSGTLQAQLTQICHRWPTCLRFRGRRPDLAWPSSQLTGGNNWHVPVTLYSGEWNAGQTSRRGAIDQFMCISIHITSAIISVHGHKIFSSSFSSRLINNNSTTHDAEPLILPAAADDSLTCDVPKSTHAISS